MSATPTYLSEFPADTDITAAEVGARLLGYELLPQGECVASVVLARDEDGLPMFPTVGILMPRRSTKTTSIWCTLVGLCATVPGYRVVTTAQDGTRAGAKMREQMHLLETNGFEDNGTGTLRWSNGRERIEFANGSVIWVVAPNPSAFRSEAADLMFFDEAGELDVDKSDGLLAGALPLLDTRPMGQAIIAGTPAEERAGLLWGTLKEGRDGDEGVGIVDYSIRDDEEAITVEEDGSFTLDESILRRVHPGIGTLTTYAKIAGRLKKMGRVAFETEYLCRFPFDSTTQAINLTKWDEAVCESFGEDKPERLALGFSVSPSGGTGALCSAWRDEDGKAHVGLIHQAAGHNWIADRAVKESRKNDKAWIGFDTIGSNQAVVEAIKRVRPTPHLSPKGTREVVSASQTFVADVHNGNLVQYDQGGLFAAVQGAVWRDIPNSGRVFGWKTSDADITPLVAAAIALHTFDNLPKKSASVAYFAA